MPHTTKTVAKNVLSNWAGLTVSMAIAFFMSPFLVRTLGDAQYGVWILILSVTGYMSLLDFGLKVSVVKYVAAHSATGDSETLGETISTALGIYSIVAALLLAVAVTVSLFLDDLFEVPGDLQPTAKVVLIIAAATLATNLVFSVFNGFIAGLQRYEIVNGVGILLSAVGAIAIYVVVSRGFGIVGVAVVHLINQVLSGMILWRVATRLRPDARISVVSIRLTRIKELYSYSIFVLLNSMAMLLLFRSGELLAGSLISAVAVTYFAIGGMLVEYLAKIVGTMTQVLHPMASGQFARGEATQLRSAVLFSTRACIAIALPACVGFVVLGAPFIAAWMGEQYSQLSGRVLAILAIGRLFWLAQSGAGNIMLGAGMHRVLALLTVTTGIIGVALAVAAAPRFGLTGIAAGLTTSIVLLQGVVVPVIVCRRMQIGAVEYMWGAVAGPVAAALPFVAVLLLANQYVVPTGLAEIVMTAAVTMLVYAAAAWFTCLNRQQREAVRTGIAGRMKSR